MGFVSTIRDLVGQVFWSIHPQNWQLQATTRCMVCKYWDVLHCFFPHSPLRPVSVMHSVIQKKDDLSRTAEIEHSLEPSRSRINKDIELLALRIAHSAGELCRARKDINVRNSAAIRPA